MKCWNSGKKSHVYEERMLEKANSEKPESNSSDHAWIEKDFHENLIELSSSSRDKVFLKIFALSEVERILDSSTKFL